MTFGALTSPKSNRRINECSFVCIDCWPFPHKIDIVWLDKFRPVPDLPDYKNNNIDSENGVGAEKVLGAPSAVAEDRVSVAQGDHYHPT